MEESSPATPLSARPVGDRLDSWKEIAAYLRRDVTTVQRWEKREGMPVHRHQHDTIGSVYALRSELDAWTLTRNLRAEQANGQSAALPEPPLQTTPPPQHQSAKSTRWKIILPVAAAALVLMSGISLWLIRTEFFWHSPIANARFQTVTDFAGLEQAAAISRDGHFVAFLSDHAGQVDVWITQVGSGEFHNLTLGTAPGLVNPSIRNLGFSPDGSLVTYWLRKPGRIKDGDISLWAVPVLGGEPRLYLEGVAEMDWSHDGSRLAYHTPGPGDPLYVSDGSIQPEDRFIFKASDGLHSHFPLWAPDRAYLYFVQGMLPDKLDIWRIRPEGGSPERITSHNGQISYPILLDPHTLLYLASDSNGSGPWMYSMDVDRRIPHRLTTNLERYTSLASTGDGRRLVATLASSKKTLWQLQINDPSAQEDLTPKTSEPSQILLTTSTGSSPRLGPGYLLYASVTGSSESIWKVENGISSELWRGEGARVIGGPAVSTDGRLVAFSIRQHEKSLLYVMQADGTNARIVTDSLDLRGTPALSPDGQSILSAAEDHGVPHLFRIPMNGGAPVALVAGYSVDPVWSPDGSFVVYSGPDIGTTFSINAVSANATPHPLPALTLTRGARHVAFLPKGHALIVLRGNIQHKDLWLIDLETGAERQVTSLPADFDIVDFDISSNGREVVLERAQENSSVVLLDLPRP